VARSDLHTTAVTKAEILFGIASIEPGRRQTAFAESAGRLFATVMANKVLPFDHVAAEHYADIVVARRRLGRPVKTPDAQIAAIARARGMAIATRDVDDFSHCGVDVINPWVA
jgi:predicted nucleic acid-binding protein